MTNVALRGAFLQNARGLNVADGVGVSWTFDAPTNTLSLAVGRGGYTVATLPAGTAGDRTYVTDANSTTFLSTVAGGGANVVPVFYNGTNWKIG